MHNLQIDVHVFQLSTIAMGEDIGLSDTEAPGLLGTYQLQLEVDVVNTNQTQNVTPTLYIVVVSEGTFTIENNRSVSQIGVISKMDILEAKQHGSPFIDYHDIMEVNGGNFMSGVARFGKDIWNKIKPYVRSAVKLGKKVYPYAKAAWNTARAVAPLLLAAGGEGGNQGGSMNAGAPSGGELIGRESGGRMVERSHLKDRLRRM